MDSFVSRITSRGGDKPLSWLAGGRCVIDPARSDNMANGVKAMASITTAKNGTRRLRFTDASGTRRTIALGKLPLKQTSQIRTHVEALISVSISRSVLADETSRWVASLDDILRGKLAKAGLIADRQNETLAGFTAAFVSRRVEVKPNTLIRWRRAITNLTAFFGGSRSLRSLTRSGVRDFRQNLLGEGYAEATVRRECGVVRQFLNDALERGLVDSNVFKQKEIPVSVNSNQERVAYNTRETSEAVLGACPDAEWRLLFALSRFAGLRYPSEHLALRWSDVNWERSRITVRSPKTEHHRDGAQRIIPIFQELRPYLEEAFEQAQPGAEFVITRYRGQKADLRTQLMRILGKACVLPWPKE